MTQNPTIRERQAAFDAEMLAEIISNVDAAKGGKFSRRQKVELLRELDLARRVPVAPADPVALRTEIERRVSFAMADIKHHNMHDKVLAETVDGIMAALATYAQPSTVTGGPMAGDVSSLIAARCVALPGPLIDCPVCGAVDRERARLEAGGAPLPHCPEDATPAQPFTVMAEPACLELPVVGTLFVARGGATARAYPHVANGPDENSELVRLSDVNAALANAFPIAPPAPSPVTPEPKSVKRTMTINLTDEEISALEEIADAKGLEMPLVFRAMLKTEQLVTRGLATVSIEGGPLSASPVTGALVEALELKILRDCLAYVRPRLDEFSRAVIDDAMAALAAQKAEG